MNRAQLIYYRKLYEVYKPEEVSKLLNVKKADLLEAADKLKVGRIGWIHRFTREQVEKLKEYFNDRIHEGGVAGLDNR